MSKKEKRIHDEAEAKKRAELEASDEYKLQDKLGKLKTQKANVWDDMIGGQKYTMKQRMVRMVKKDAYALKEEEEEDVRDVVGSAVISDDAEKELKKSIKQNTR